MIDGTVDVSHWDPIHDPAAMNAAGIVAVIAKATEGMNFRDDQYAHNKAASAGLLFGAYHFGDGGDPVGQADFFINSVQPDGQTLLCLDFEANMTVAEAEQFVSRVHDVVGCWPVLYTRAGYITQQIGSKSTLLSSCPLWVASYRDTPLLPPQWTRAALWQYTNGQDGPEPHSTPGVGSSNAPDRSRFDGTFDDMRAFWASVSGRATPVVIKPIVVQRWVSASILNVRSAPVIADNLIGHLKLGDSVEINAALITNGFVPLTTVVQGEQAWISQRWIVDWQPTPVPTVIVVPPATTGGFGAQVLGSAYDPALAKYPVLKGVDNPNAVADYHQRNPTGLCIHRHYYVQPYDSDWGKYIAESGGPAPAARRWFTENAVTMAALPFALHEGGNEGGTDPASIEFEYQRVALMASKGYRACILNLGVGHYNDDTLWQRADVQRLVALTIQYHGAIGLHCYGQAILSSNCGPYFWKADGLWSMGGDPLPTAIDPAQCWLALRILRVRDVLAVAGLHPQLVSTELGLDDNAEPGNGVYRPFGIQTRGWKSCFDVWQRAGWLGDPKGRTGITPQQFYLRQLQWWVDRTGLLGTVYAHGDDGTFDTRGLL